MAVLYSDHSPGTVKFSDISQTFSLTSRHHSQHSPRCVNHFKHDLYCHQYAVNVTAKYLGSLTTTTAITTSV